MKTYDKETAPTRDSGHRSTAAMINDCFRHQHPEAYGQPAVPEPAIPTHLRYGHDQPIPASRVAIAEEQMGIPGIQPLAD
jgi:hypothetical protein